MTSAILGRGTPVTEEEFFTLGETSKRIELFDNHYLERSVTRPGEVLHLVEPLTADLVPEDLLPPG